MFFLINEKRIHYSDDGVGNPIVLLHGYLESSEVWEGFQKKLSSGFRVIAMDLPGHGLSDECGEEYTMDYMASIVKELLEYLQIKKVFIIGHSLGGYIALAFLENFPDYLYGYSLFHSHPFADSPEVILKREREIEIVKAGKKDMMYSDNVVRMFATANIEKFSEAMVRSKDIASKIPGNAIIAVLKGMIIRPSRLSLLEEGRIPFLWILGLMDNYIPCETIRNDVRLPANSEVVILQNSGHIGFVEEEDKSVKVISDFVINLQA